MSRPVIALYDMDRTLTRGGTYTPFLIRWAWKYAPWRLLLIPLAVLNALAYLLGIITRGRLKTQMQVIMMGTQPKERINKAAQDFACWVHKRYSLPGALRQLEQDRTSGARIVWATASFDYYVAAIMKEFGGGDMIATKSIWKDGSLIPGIDGENCYGAVKLQMVQDWFDRQGIDRNQVHLRFYSDHISDKPVFDWADEAIAANPSRKLQRLAEEKGWHIADWRN